MLALAIVAVITNTDEVRACLPAPDGAVVIGTAGGLVRSDDKHGVKVITASDGLPDTRIDAVVPDRDGVHAWIGTDAGVAEVDLASLAIVQATASRPVRDIARLGDAVFLATWGGGVVKLGGDTPVALAMTGGTTAARLQASALVVAGGTLYAGTAAGLYELREGVLDKVAGTPPDVASLAVDRDGAVWLATPDGAWRRDAGGQLAHLGGGDVRRIAIVDGAVTLAGDGGVQVVVSRRSMSGSDIGRGRVVAVPGAPNTGLVQALAARGDAVCAGGLDGLWTRPTRAATWQHATPRGGLPSNDIAALAADGDTLWVGTFDRGLATLRAGRWRTIATPGLDARIDAIVVGPDAIWVGTAEGLVALAKPNEDDDAPRVIARFTRGDGLPGRSVLALARLSDGRMVVGSSSGAAVIDGGHLERIGPTGVGNVWAIAEGTNGTLWLGATTGLYHGAATAWAHKDGGDTDASAPAWTRFSVASGALRDDWVTAIATRGDAVWVGTYKRGVTRIDKGVATALGDGWVNPAGLTWEDDHLRVSTMDGLQTGDGANATWTTTAGLPGHDVTATVRVGGTLWVATRRGLAR